MPRFDIDDFEPDFAPDTHTLDEIEDLIAANSRIPDHFNKGRIPISVKRRASLRSIR